MICAYLVVLWIWETSSILRRRSMITRHQTSSCLVRIICKESHCSTCAVCNVSLFVVCYRPPPPLRLCVCIIMCGIHIYAGNIQLDWDREVWPECSLRHNCWFSHIICHDYSKSYTVATVTLWRLTRPTELYRGAETRLHSNFGKLWQSWY